MTRKKMDLAIINRDFWPQGQVIGEALLQFAEQAAEQHSVCVITQTNVDITRQLADIGRGAGLQIRACKSYTTSASGVVRRIAETVFFMFWVLFSLIRVRPANVYIATNPPVVVPFIVALYCRAFRARYAYHLQDIHPEATNIVVPLNRVLFRLLQRLDNYTLRHAGAIITLSEEMKNYAVQRSATLAPITLLDNPSFEAEPVAVEKRSKDIVFCGNAGRLQRIPLLLGAIENYLQQDGKLRFTFAGGGVHAQDIQALAESYEQVEYLGVIPAAEAAELVSQHRWALLPIDDEVTQYAFPSKSSGYALSGAGILAVCGEATSVAKWVTQHGVGHLLPVNQTAMVESFFRLEEQTGRSFLMSAAARSKLSIPHFASKLCSLVLPSSVKAETEC